MDVLIVVLAAGVALGYFALAFLVLPRIELVDASPSFRRAFRVGGIAFFAGCGLTHTHIAVHAAGDGELVAWHEVLFHGLQLVGVWVFVYVAIRVIDVRIERRQTPTEELEAQVSELARSNEDLEQFAHVISHDLQGPLVTAAGFAELLDNNRALDADARRHLDAVRSSHRQMRELLDGVLRYSRAAGAGLRREQVDLNLTATEVTEALAHDIEATGAQVTIGRLPVVTGDPVQLRQVLLNLTANAVKFANDQRPDIAISAEEHADGWQITVRDRGPGIPDADRDGIFEMFGRAATADGTAGSGIGLAVCRKIVTRHGGTIGVSETAGGGATFYFTLPRRTSAVH